MAHTHYHSIIKSMIAAVMIFTAATAHAQSDIEEMKYLRLHGIEVTEGNNMYLLKSGHDKFLDMFDAIRQAKSFVHLEYFNFRTRVSCFQEAP